jgi:hypothetical protein
MKRKASHALVLLACLAGASRPAMAGVETVEIGKIQVVKAISGVVRDPNGAPISGATVEEVSPDWKTVIRTTTTDASGTFGFVPTAKNRVYHLRISLTNFNPLIVHVKLSRWTRKSLNLKLELGT